MRSEIHRVCALVLGCVLVVGGTAVGATSYVPDHFATMQAGLDAVADGDVIIVRDGTWTGADNRNLDFNGKAVTLRSLSGPAACTIDCEGAERGVYFHRGEGAGSVLSGFTITNGTSRGAGIYCSQKSSPTISNCVITGNDAGSAEGGGIFCISESSPAITACTVSENTAAGSAGGIGLSSASSATIMHCTITKNTGPVGGIHCYTGSNAVITNSIISENTATSNGGGIHATSSSPTITGCEIYGNTSSACGGGFYGSNYSSTITDTIITDNTAGEDGGGVCCKSGSPTLTNCTIAENEATGSGGGVFWRSVTAAMMNCTVSENDASVKGGGLYGYGSTLTATVANSILWGDDAPSGPELCLEGSSTVDIGYSDVQGGEAGAQVCGACTLNWGAGNIKKNPKFVGSGDYHLTAKSPCIDVGTPTGAPDHDIDGDGRPQGDGPDMGSDEYAAQQTKIEGCVAVDGVPVEKALVILKLKGEAKQKVRTDADGNWLFMDVDTSKKGTIRIKLPGSR